MNSGVYWASSPTLGVILNAVASPLAQSSKLCYIWRENKSNHLANNRLPDNSQMHTASPCLSFALQHWLGGAPARLASSSEEPDVPVAT